MTPALSHSDRAVLQFVATYDELAKGEGDARQQAAYRELEWRLCARSFEYWLDRYAYIKAKDGSGFERWRLWPTQRKFARELQSGKSFVIVKCRQIAVTTMVAHYFFWKAMFHDGATCSIIADSETKAADAKSRIDGTLMHLPSWMMDRAHVIESSADTRSEGSRKEIKTRRRDRQDGLMRLTMGLSSVRVLTSTMRSVQGIIGDVLLDEFQLHPDQERIWQMVLAAYRPTSGGRGGQLIVVGNGRGRDMLYHLYMKAVAKDIDLVPHFFSWRFNPEHALDAAWYEQEKKQYLIKNPGRDISAFRAQHPTTVQEAFEVGASSRFRQDVLTRMFDEAQVVAEANRALGMDWPQLGDVVRDGGSYRFDAWGNGTVRLYEPPKKGERYVLAADPAGGTTDGSWAAAVVCRVQSPALVQVAVYESRHEPDVFAQRVADLAEFYNNAHALVFRANHGHLVISRLKDRYSNLYRHIETSRSMTDKTGDTVGYPENKATKMHLIDTLAEWLHDSRITVYDTRTIEELTTLEVQPNGTTDPQSGTNDDLVDALAGCCIAAESRTHAAITQPAGFDYFGNPIYDEGD